MQESETRRRAGCRWRAGAVVATSLLAVVAMSAATLLAVPTATVRTAPAATTVRVVGQTAPPTERAGAVGPRRGDGWTAPDGTITRITGTRRDGFRVDRLHRRTDFLPTLSEVLAECSAYPRLRRGRCEARTRARYHALGQMKRAIRYARQS